MFEEMNKRLQLHQRIKIIYVVTHVEARFYNQDGDILAQVGRGETVEEALNALENALNHIPNMNIKGDEYHDY